MSAKITISFDELLRLKAEARGFSFLPRQPVASLLAGRHGSRLRGRGLSFEELRHYQPGDDVRAIDWRATARRGTPQIRVYNEERERPVLVVLDQRSPMFFGSRGAMKSVVAAQISALAAWKTLDSGDRIGGLVFNEAEIVEVRPHHSQARVLQLMHVVEKFNQALADKHPPEGSVTLNDALAATRCLAKHDHLVVLVTDLDGADGETQRLATQLAVHNDVLVVMTYDPLGASLRGHPGMRVFDRTEQCEVPTGPEFPKMFQEVFAKQLGEWRQIFRNLKVPVLPVSTAVPVAEQLRGLFGETSNPGGGS